MQAQDSRRTVAFTTQFTSAVAAAAHIVVNPVSVSKSGHTLLERDVLGALVDELLQLASVPSTAAHWWPARRVRPGRRDAARG